MFGCVISQNACFGASLQHQPPHLPPSSLDSQVQCGELAGRLQAVLLRNANIPPGPVQNIEQDSQRDKKCLSTIQSHLPTQRFLQDSDSRACWHAHQGYPSRYYSRNLGQETGHETTGPYGRPGLDMNRWCNPHQAERGRHRQYGVGSSGVV